MRATPAFDTHAFAKKLVAAGVPEAQAEVHAEALVETAFAGLATKQDIEDLKRDLAALEARMDARFRDLEARFKDLELRLTLRFGVMLAAAVTILAVLEKLL